MEKHDLVKSAPVRKRLTVALPGSLTKDIPHLREKTARVGQIGRTLAIFGVDRVMIYRDETSGRVWEEAAFLEKILRFQETPQYLRRHLFKLDPDLQYTGTLPPLRIPSHPNRALPEPGQVREAVVLTSQGPESKADAGFKDPVLIARRLPVNSRVTIQITRVSPRLEAEPIDRDGLRIYWGFRVQREDVTLEGLHRRMKSDLTIATSRDGDDVRDAMAALKARWQSTHHPLVLFGSPDKSIEEILANSKATVDQIADFRLNMVPGQNVETVRTEEALMITLSILNALEEA